MILLATFCIDGHNQLSEPVDGRLCSYESPLDVELHVNQGQMIELCIHSGTYRMIRARAAVLYERTGREDTLVWGPSPVQEGEWTGWVEALGDMLVHQLAIDWRPMSGIAPTLEDLPR